MAPYEVATFDNYGTLTDWEGGIAQFLYRLALRNGDRLLVPGSELQQEFEAIQYDLIGGSYRSYKQVLAESLATFCDRHGWPYDDRLGRDLADAMRSWSSFLDTNPALTRAKAAGMKLAILSNTDRDIISHSIRHHRVAFDFVITAEDTRTYKPDDAFFAYALAEIGVPADRIIHVAFGFKYDNAPAKRAGLTTAWVNRHNEPQRAGVAADHVWRDLWPLAGLADGRPIPE
ncbi:haloacid dehalogenase type II [Fodinicola acaciae]|uniref:haloacid dehalogenase type II n=1 Tax=Fodinicola acaciae TaxID=2681555 RepID=UPI0013CFDC50|nr:haloacid dehalogenase type II [Fodinicola acaciae]